MNQAVCVSVTGKKPLNQTALLKPPLKCTRAGHNGVKKLPELIVADLTAFCLNAGFDLSCLTGKKCKRGIVLIQTVMKPQYRV
jgi:hypothetical protein